MAIDSKHPQYIKFKEDWEQMEDTYRGERVVKEKGTLYLPPTSGMVADGMTNAESEGTKAYNAYKKRAIFHEFVSDAVEAAIGIMHHKPPTIELPSALEPLRENATISGESLEGLLRRINEQQLVTGRLGLLADLPEIESHTINPYLALYSAGTIINWDVGAKGELVKQNLNLVVLDESEDERGETFEWSNVSKFRVLVLGDLTINEPEKQGAYQYGIFKTGESFNVSSLNMPRIRGEALKQIPFVFINSKDNVADPDDPPLIGLSSLSLAIYRGEADYRQSLFLQGQDTLVIVGGESESKVRVGANAILNLPNIGSSAEYIGVSSDGLKEQREALENDKLVAASKAGRFLSSRSKSAESGEALEIRLTAETASLNQIAISGAAGLQKALRIIAEWVGANPEEVLVKPNLEFAKKEISGRDLLEYQSAKNLGAPISSQTIHEIMQKRGLTSLSYDEEIEYIENEVPQPTGIDDDLEDEDLDPDQE
jgi:hypothetical protein